MNMKSFYRVIMMTSCVLVGLSQIAAAAVTVYLKDGTRLEAEKVVRIGDSVAVFLDISRIDTRRTPIEETDVEQVLQDSGLKTDSVLRQGLTVTNLRFEPSADNTEILAFGTIENHTRQRVGNLHITVTLMDRQDRVLLTIHGYPYPDVLDPGQAGAYAFRARRPRDFGKASVEVNADGR